MITSKKTGKMGTIGIKSSGVIKNIQRKIGFEIPTNWISKVLKSESSFYDEFEVNSKCILKQKNQQ